LNKIRRYLFIFIATTIATSSALAQERVFVFAPPDSLSYARGVFTSHARLADGQVGLVDTVKSFYQDQYIKSPIGYDLRSVPDSIVATRDGKPLDSPIADAMSRTPYTLVLDDDGHALSAQGFDKLIDNLEVEDSTLLAEIRANTNDRAMSAKMATEWNSVIDPLVGQKVSIGAISHIQETFRYGAMTTLEFFTSVEVSDTFMVDGALCARVFLHSDSDLSRLAERRNISTEEMMKSFGVTAEELPQGTTAAASMRVGRISQ